MKSLTNNKLYNIKSLIPALCIIASGISSYAAESKDPIIDLDEYVVTANRMEVPINSTGASITVITAEEIENSKQQFVVDVIKSVPGVNVRQTGRQGRKARVSIRGTESYQSVILIDGIKITDTNDGDGFTINTLPVDNIERIEVLRGSQSVLYGSEAMGGVINIITKKGSKKFKGSANLMTGAYETTKGTLQISGANEKLDFTASLSRTELDSNAADNDPEEDKYESIHFNGNLNYRITDLLTIKYNTILQEINADTDSSAANDPIAKDIYRNYFNGLHFNLDSENDTWNSILSTTYNNQENIFKGTNSSYDYEGEKIGIDWQNNFNINERHTTIAGIEYEQDTGKEEGSWFAGWLGANHFKYIFQTKAIYAQHHYNHNNKLFLDIGGRFTDADKFGNSKDFQSSASYLINESTRIKSSYGSSFNAPNSFFVINAQNPNTLKPEDSTSFDLGIEQKLLENKMSLGVTYFHNDIKQQFAWTGGKAVNLESVRTQGYELYSSYTPIDDLNFSANYTWLDSLDRSNGHDLHHAPKQNIYADVNWKTLEKKLNLNLSVNYVGGMFNDLNNEADYSSPYMIWNTAASYQVSDKLEIYGRIDNLFDSDYQAMKDTNSRDYASIQGLSTYVGMRYKF